MDRVENEPLWLRSPDIANVFVRRAAAECLDPAGEIVGRHEVGKVRPELTVVVVMASLHRRLLDRSVHPLELAIGLRMVWLGRSMPDPIRLADHGEAHLPSICCLVIAALLGELDARTPSV